MNGQKNLEIFEEMLELAETLGARLLKNPWEGIEVDIKIGKVVNPV